MKPNEKTRLLLLTLLAIVLVNVFAWIYFTRQRPNASRSETDLRTSDAELAQLAPESSPGAGPSNAGLDGTINRTLRAAAISTDISSQLASIDPGVPSPVRGSSLQHVPIYLRLNAVRLQQLVAFLSALSEMDNTLRTTDIELSLPVSMPTVGAGGDAWTADITLSYLQSSSAVHP